MTYHHDRLSTRASKKPDGFNWSLDQELREKSSTTNPLIIPRSSGGGSGSGGNPEENNSNSEDLQGEICRLKIREWFEDHEISTINFFLTNYSAAPARYNRTTSEIYTAADSSEKCSRVIVCPSSTTRIKNGINNSCRRLA